MTEPSKPEDVQYDIPIRNGRPFGIREDLYVQLKGALVNQNQVFHINEENKTLNNELRDINDDLSVLADDLIEKAGPNSELVQGLDRVNAALWSDQGEFNQMLAEFADEQTGWNATQQAINENHTAAIAESSSMLDEVMAQVVDLRQKLEDIQGEQWDVFTLAPNGQVGYFTSNSTRGSYVRISVGGTQTGKIIATAVFDNSSGGQTQSAYTWTLGATRQWDIPYPSALTIAYIRIEWQKSATQIIRSNTTVRDINIDEDTWTTLHSLTIPKDAECIASMRVGWHAATNSDQYGLRISVGNTAVASDGPRNGIGPLTPFGNGYRVMTASNSSFNAAEGDVVRLEVYSGGDVPHQRRVRDATLNIAWLDVG